MGHKHISLKGSQSEAFEDVAELVKEDAGEEDMTRGEIVEHLADAYRGLL